MDGYSLLMNTVYGYSFRIPIADFEYRMLIGFLLTKHLTLTDLCTKIKLIGKNIIVKCSTLNKENRGNCEWVISSQW